MKPDPYSRGYSDGLRAAITWLHQEARKMNDPKARDVLNSAGYSLGNLLRADGARRSAALPRAPD